MIRQRLYLQIYVTIVAALALTVAVTGVLFAALDDGDRPSATAIALAGRAVAEGLPPPDASAAAHRTVLERVARDIAIDLAVFDAGGTLIATTGGWEGISGRSGPSGTADLPDGRRIEARVLFPGFGGAFALPLLLACVALAVAIASYPLVRRLAGRLERLQSTVERIGDGDLAARAEVEGQDEIAELAESFNDAASRIERLVDAQRTLLANTSHELRTPLARIRLGIEMARDTGDLRRLVDAEADIAELDGLIHEILTLSRLDTVPAAMEADVDLLGLAAEEAARVGADVSGRPVLVTGHPDLLRRLVRNLLENAVRHGAPPVEVEVGEDGDFASLTVCDGGKGIDLAEREKVFERFRRGADARGTEGYGLGLALVRQIAEVHDGHVGIEVGSASRMRVTLPRPLRR